MAAETPSRVIPARANTFVSKPLARRRLARSPARPTGATDARAHGAPSRADRRCGGDDVQRNALRERERRVRASGDVQRARGQAGGLAMAPEPFR